MFWAIAMALELKPLPEKQLVTISEFLSVDKFFMLKSFYILTQKSLCFL